MDGPDADGRGSHSPDSTGLRIGARHPHAQHLVAPAGAAPDDHRGAVVVRRSEHVIRRGDAVLMTLDAGLRPPGIDQHRSEAREPAMHVRQREGLDAWLVTVPWAPAAVVGIEPFAAPALDLVTPGIGRAGQHVPRI